VTASVVSCTLAVVATVAVVVAIEVSLTAGVEEAVCDGLMTVGSEADADVTPKTIKNIK